MQKTYAVILAGGQGIRLGKDMPKQFLKLIDRPVIVHTLEKFNIPGINGKIVVVPEEYIEHTLRMIEEYSIPEVIKVIKGGETRQGSSYKALMCMNFNDDDILLFHDAARPFINSRIITKCIEETAEHGASGVYVKATDTIAEMKNNFVGSIPPREKLFYTQTPQSFKYRIIKEAHEKAASGGNTGSTDDVQLVINSGYKVKIVEGDYSNIKITTPFDLQMAEFIAAGLTSPDQ